MALTISDDLFKNPRTRLMMPCPWRSAVLCGAGSSGRIAKWNEPGRLKEAGSLRYLLVSVLYFWLGRCSYRGSANEIALNRGGSALQRRRSNSAEPSCSHLFHLWTPFKPAPEAWNGNSYSWLCRCSSVLGKHCWEHMFQETLPLPNSTSVLVGGQGVVSNAAAIFENPGNGYVGTKVGNQVLVGLQGPSSDPFFPFTSYQNMYY